MEETTKKMQSGEVKPIAPDALQAMLPASIAGWNRTEISSRGGAAGGLGGSNAATHYSSGDQAFTLSLTDAGALGALATRGGALSGQQSRHPQTGSHTTTMQDGTSVGRPWGTTI